MLDFLSSAFSGASGTAGGVEMLQNFNTGLDWFQKRKRVEDYNKQVLNDFYLKRDKYHADFNAKKVAWAGQNIDREKAIDDNWQSYLERKSANRLKIWQGVKDGSNANQQLFAAMLANDGYAGSAQQGKRGGAFTNRRKAVLEYAAQKNRVAYQLIANSDYEALESDYRLNSFKNSAHQLSAEAQMSTPVAGIPPRSGQFMAKPGVGELILNLSSNMLKGKMLRDKLSPPFTDDEMRDRSNIEQQPTSTIQSTIDDTNYQAVDEPTFVPFSSPLQFEREMEKFNSNNRNQLKTASLLKNQEVFV